MLYKPVAKAFKIERAMLLNDRTIYKFSFILIIRYIFIYRIQGDVRIHLPIYGHFSSFLWPYSGLNCHQLSRSFAVALNYLKKQANKNY